MDKNTLNIVCPSCKTTLYSDDVFCGNCGKNVKRFVEKTIKQEDKRKKKEEAERLRKEREKQAIEQRKQKEAAELQRKENEKQAIENRKREEAAAIIKKRQCERDALDLLVEHSGNTFAAAKALCEQHNLSSQEAMSFISSAASKSYSTPNKPTEQSNFAIAKTIIVSQDSRKKVGSTVIRGAVGGALLGPVGLLAGASGKNKHTTTFQVIYKNGQQKTVTVDNNSMAFKEYVRYL